MKAILMIAAYFGLVLLICSMFKINRREADE